MDEFAQSVASICHRVETMLVEKNKSYGNSALDPIRVFAKGDRIDLLHCKIDDKLSRIARGHEMAGEDTVFDLIGYLVILLIARGIT